MLKGLFMTASRLDRLEQRVDKMDKDVHAIKNSMQLMTANISSMDASMDAFNDMAHTIDKIWKWLKRGLPIVATGAISSGIVSGKWGAFFQALFH